MDTQTRSTSQPQHAQYPTTANTLGRSAGRSIVAAVVLGAVAAVALTFVVFPGAAEATTTGLLLLAFGFGWAVMVTLTVRRTREPQRWAAVPAVAMGVTGLALVTFTPGDRTVTALNWVWPPLMAALAVWMFVQVRRSVPGKARWVLFPVISVLVLASAGAVYADVVEAGTTADEAVPGTLYDIGGHRLHLDCHGHGSPTVVLLNGTGGLSAGWTRITAPLSRTTRVCAYDRPGQGWSDEIAPPQDGVEASRDLHGLLAAAGEQGPFVLAGHSTGGTYAMTYAARHPEQVAGMVLLDSSSPEQFTRMPAFSGQYRMMMRPMYGLLPTLSRLGLGHLVPGASSLPPADAAVVDAMTSQPRSYRNQRDEVSVLPRVFHQAEALTTLGDRPLAVLTASETRTRTVGWAAAQDQLATLSGNSDHRTVSSSHEGLLEDARPAAASVHVIREVVSSVRTGSPIASR